MNDYREYKEIGDSYLSTIPTLLAPAVLLYVFFTPGCSDAVITLTIVSPFILSYLLAIILPKTERSLAKYSNGVLKFCHGVYNIAGTSIPVNEIEEMRIVKRSASKTLYIFLHNGKMKKIYLSAKSENNFLLFLKACCPESLFKGEWPK